MRLKDQIAVVTGAGRNIGEDICKLYVQEGAKVAVADLDQGRSSRVADEINAKNAGSALLLFVTSRQHPPSTTWYKPS